MPSESTFKRPAYHVWLLGPAGCLDRDSYIQFSIRAPEGRYQSHKGGSIRDLYRRFHDLPIEGKHGRYYDYRRDRTAGSLFFAPSVTETGKIVRNRILDVVQTGTQECYTVSLGTGEVLTATSDHRFYVGDGKFVRLSDLRVGDRCFIHNNTLYQKAEKQKAAKRSRHFCYVKHHGTAPIKMVRQAWGGQSHEYRYHRLPRARMVMEAVLNELSVESYLARLNTGKIDGLTFLTSDMEVHHRDENTLNDHPDNLEILSSTEHALVHMTAEREVRFCVQESRIATIEKAGMRETYDLSMEAPYNNYVANGIVVHNSGKTFAALSFPRICAIQFDPTGLDIIYDPDSRASEFRKNLIWRIPLNGLPREDVFAPDTGQVNETSLYGAINTAIQLKQKGQCDTLLLDGYTFLASERWNHIFTNEDEQIRTTKGNLDHQKMYGRLGSWLAAFTLQDLPRLCTVYGMNVVVTCHLQRESENAIKGMATNTGNPMLDQQAKAQKRLVTLDSDMAPQIVGSFRQQVDALPSAMIYLDHFQDLDKDGKTPIEKHLAFCRQVYVKRWDTVVKAKNRYGLPASMDVTGKSFHGILVGKFKAAEEARKAKEEAQVKAAAGTDQASQTEGANDAR